MKQCSKCPKVLPESAFYKDRGDCKVCHGAATAKYRRDHPEKVKAYAEALRKLPEKVRSYRKTQVGKRKTHDIRSRYRLSLDQFELMLADQDGKCGICLDDVPVLNIDHCHVTGRVRGLLCMRCNLGLGQFRDSPELIQKALKYLALTS